MIVYDIETAKGPDEVEGGWNNPYGMSFGTAVTYNYADDVYRFYVPDDKDKLISDLASGGTIISFNGIKFDNRVLLGNNYMDNERLWRDCDLLLAVVQGKFDVNTVAEAEQKVGAGQVHDGSIGLDGLAKGTLNSIGKIGHGSKSPAMIQAGNWRDVFQYNLHDVRLTRQLFEFARKYGILIDGKGQSIKMDMRGYFPR